MREKVETMGFAFMIIASVTLQQVGTVIGIIGGIAGIYALHRVTKVVDPLEKFIKQQTDQVQEHKAAVEELSPDDDA